MSTIPYFTKPTYPKIRYPLWVTLKSLNCYHLSEQLLNCKILYYVHAAESDTINDNEESMDVDNAGYSSIPFRSRTSKWQDRKMFQKKIEENAILKLLHNFRFINEYAVVQRKGSMGLTKPINFKKRVQEHFKFRV